MDTRFVVSNSEPEMIENDYLTQLDISLPILKSRGVEVQSVYKKYPKRKCEILPQSSNYFPRDLICLERFSPQVNSITK